MATHAHSTVEMDGRTITILDLGAARTYFDLISAVHQGLSAGYDDFEIRVLDNIRVFPNAAVPCLAAIEHWRRSGLAVSIASGRNEYAARAGFRPAQGPDAQRRNAVALGSVVSFGSSADVNEIVTSFIDELSSRLDFAPGALLALEWALNEAMDNVLVHAEVETGFLMCQCHQHTGRVAICIADTGRGVLESFRGSKHGPRNHVDALTLAIKRGVTRDEKIGQGNGLWGLSEIVRANGGSLRLVSGAGSMSITGDNMVNNGAVPCLDRRAQATIVDCQFSAASAVTLKDVLGGHQPVNLRLEAAESHAGTHAVRVSEVSEGTGTRMAARAVRTRVRNLLNEGASIVVLDFGGVRVASSSYADELIGKLVAEIGFVAFNQQFRIAQADDLVQTIVDRSVLQRLATKFDAQTNAQGPVWTVTDENDENDED